MIFSILKKNISKKKLNDNGLENDELFEVKDLYITNLGKVTAVYLGYKLCVESTEPIIIKRINHNKKVLDVLNNIEYFHYYSIYGIGKFLGCYMAGELKPVSMVLKDKTKTHIFKSELLKIFYPESEMSVTNEIKDIVLKQVKETDNKINSSSLTKEEKQKLKNKLVEIARTYVDILKNMGNSSSKAISLNVSYESIINLRKEIMRKLVEIEIQLPPENIHNISNELKLLEQEIVKSK